MNIKQNLNEVAGEGSALNDGLERILPCPFCGSNAEEYPDGDMEGFSIMCSGDKPFVLFGGEKANCPLSTFGYETRKASIDSWNMRSNAF